MKNAFLVYDTLKPSEIHLPPAMGTPRSDQLRGSPLEKLAEIAGRVCYDSFGVGRPSSEYLEHILEVNHTSVLAHCVISIELPLTLIEKAALACINRPGVLVQTAPSVPCTMVSANVRAIVEWNSGLTEPQDDAGSASDEIYAALIEELHLQMPRFAGLICDVDDYRESRYRPVYGSDPKIRNISLWLRGSRGFSHEMVRHNWRCAVSQRSTRYVDESESPWCLHPDIVALDKAADVCGGISGGISAATRSARKTYSFLFTKVEQSLRERYPEMPTSTRVKRARGAARSVLGNALETQMIFSASVEQWHRIFEQRCSPAADPEIREIMMEAQELVPAR